MHKIKRTVVQVISENHRRLSAIAAAKQMEIRDAIDEAVVTWCAKNSSAISDLSAAISGDKKETKTAKKEKEIIEEPIKQPVTKAVTSGSYYSGTVAPEI